MKYKVLHLSTSHSGGAGIAARNMSRELNLNGVSSAFISLENESFFPEDNEFAIKRSVLTKYQGGLTSRIQDLLSSKTYFTLVSVPALNIKDLQKFGTPGELTLHIHNWFNLAGIRTFRKLARRGYRFVFTLHDMRLLTGGCHYSLQCIGFKKGCKNCPHLPQVFSLATAKNHSRQVEFFREFSTVIRVVAPSRWLTSIASKHFFPLGITPEYVPNYHPSLPLNSKKTVSKFDSGRSLRLGIASANLSSYLKGGDLTDALLQEIKLRRIPADMLFLRDFSDQKDGMESFWSSIDFLLVLSRADNSPNVIHEARIHGVPVIGTDVGGIPELLDNAFDIKIETKDAKVPFLADLIENLLLRKEQYSKITPPAFEYSSESILKIAEVYRGFSV